MSLPHFNDTSSWEPQEALYTPTTGFWRTTRGGDAPKAMEYFTAKSQYVATPTSSIRQAQERETQATCRFWQCTAAPHSLPRLGREIRTDHTDTAPLAHFLSTAPLADFLSTAAVPETGPIDCTSDFPRIDWPALQFSPSRTPIPLTDFRTTSVCTQAAPQKLTETPTSCSTSRRDRRRSDTAWCKVPRPTVLRQTACLMHTTAPSFYRSDRSIASLFCAPCLSIDCSHQ